MAATANDLTRQQLDELDALLQRMLTVPATKADSEPVTRTQTDNGWRADPPSGPSPPHLDGNALHLLAEPAPLTQAPLLPEPEVPPTPAMLFVPEPPAPVGVLELPEEFDALNLAELTAQPTVDLSVAPAEAKVAKVHPAAYPLFAMNWLLEGTLKLSGPPGVLMTSRVAKNTLAACGIIMMLGAALWTAQGFCLVKLPLDKVLKRN